MFVPCLMQASAASGLRVKIVIDWWTGLVSGLVVGLLDFFRRGAMLTILRPLLSFCCSMCWIVSTMVALSKSMHSVGTWWTTIPSFGLRTSIPSYAELQSIFLNLFASSVVLHLIRMSPLLSFWIPWIVGFDSSRMVVSMAV